MAQNTPSRKHCDFSCTDRMCVTLDKAGVPPEQKWRTLILYMRGLEDYMTLTETQKGKIQNLVLETLRGKNYTNEAFERIIQRKQEILGEHCNKRLQSALAETVELIEEFGKIILERKDDVSNLGKNTIETLESGVDPLRIVEKLKEAFRTVVSTMEADSQQLKEISRTDSLTQLYNRRGFDEFLDEQVERWKQQGDPLSLILLDIDHFKDFNDTHGHRIGDQALATVGRIIKNYGERLGPMLPGEYFPARYGGEEFAVVLPSASLEEAIRHADSLRQAIKRYNFVIRNPSGEVMQRDVRISISGGVATMHPAWKGAFSENLIDAADKALYQAKYNGRDQIIAYHPDNSRG